MHCILVVRSGQDFEERFEPVMKELSSGARTQRSYHVPKRAEAPERNRAYQALAFSGTRPEMARHERVAIH